MLASLEVTGADADSSAVVERTSRELMCWSWSSVSESANIPANKLKVVFKLFGN